MIIDKTIAEGKKQEIKSKEKKPDNEHIIDLIYHIFDDSPRMCHGNGHNLLYTCLAWIELEV